MILGESIKYRIENGKSCSICSWSAEAEIASPIHQGSLEVGNYQCPVCSMTMNIKLDDCRKQLIPIYLPEISQADLNVIMITSAYLHSKAINVLAPSSNSNAAARELADKIKAMSGGVPANLQQRSLVFANMLYSNAHVKAKLESEVNFSKYGLLEADVKNIIKEPTWLVDALLDSEEITQDQLGGVRLLIKAQGLLIKNSAPGMVSSSLVDVVSSQKSEPASFEDCMKLFLDNSELINEFVSKVMSQ